MESIEKQKEYFKKLTTDRAESAKTLEKPSLRGVKHSVVDKYSDQAHFIYELLQNADDAQATKSKFILTNEGLTFIHNGTIGFTVSNPETEEEDSKNKKLGHINAITSIGFTTKDEAKIGKFGVGFKAIFQYSNTPHIYDPNFSFKIERFIVPQQLEQDHSQRQEKETLFFFPFDLPKKSNEEAANDILQKLKSLIHPVLFLYNLKEVVWEAQSENGKYTKVIKEQKQIGETLCQRINLADGSDKKRLWLFTRVLEESSHKYSLGFFIDKNNKLEPSKSYSAFCFFPTKENTNLKFIIQAPFLLTDSREGIRAGNSWNDLLVNKLSVLAAESLMILKKIGIEKGSFLIDDNIVNIIPYKQNNFTSLTDRNKISFLPFYYAIKGKLQSETLLPAKHNRYSSKNLSYWASDTELTELFTNKQLADLMEKENAKWVFTSFGRKQNEQANPALVEYIDGGNETRNIPSNLIITHLTPDKILRKISAKFVENQPNSWLKKLYSYLLERRALWEKETSILRNKPIFKNSSGKAVSAFDLETGKNLVLFFPSGSVTTNQTIHIDFLNHPDSKKFFLAFGIDTPKLKDEIFNNIVPQYKNDIDYGDEELIKQHFISFLEYFNECPNIQLSHYIGELKKIEFVACRKKENIEDLYFEIPSKLYQPTDDLVKYFANKPDTLFVDLDFYSSFIPTEQQETFKKFLVEIDVKDLPVIYPINKEYSQKVKDQFSIENYQLSNKHFGEQKVLDKIIDGSEEAIQNISRETSQLIWKILCQLIAKHGSNKFQSSVKGIYKYVPYWQQYSQTVQFDSTEFIRLTTSEWLYTKTNTIVSASAISVEDLADDYDIISNEAKSLIEFLGIANPDAELNLSDEQLSYYELGKKLSQQGITQKDLPDLLQLLLQKQSGKSTDTSTNENDDEETAIDKTLKKIKEKLKNTAEEETDQEKTSDDKDEKDEDYFTKATVDFDKRRERLTEKVKAEIEQLTRIQELTEAANNAEKYSFIWFKSLLELEYLNSYESNSKGKEISIQFTKVEKEIGTDRTLILKNPNRYIPQSIEDIGDLTVRLYYGSESSSVSVEVVNVKEYTLRAKLNKSADISNIDLSTIYNAVIDIKNPIFILDELRKNFSRLPFEDSFNLQKNLTENIEFVFGPPGTGKTTYLSNNILIPLMQKEEDFKILVLTPTNKAADVLVNKIMETMKDDESYFRWLVRFGLTGDSAIEKSPIFFDKTLDIRTKSRNVTVTTIARFPYDYFQPDRLNHRLHLREIQWDYIVIDEASMIPLVNIIFPLYYKTDAIFIVAGDPFQIQPITSVAEWKDENIYTLIGLNNFKTPKTIPHDYKVVNLPTQYRSIPSIGSLFSHFTYDGILKNHRKESSQRPLKLDGLKIKDINIVKFTVSPFDSIYKAKKLNHSSNYHIYSAIFTYEFAKYISEQINRNHSEHYKIGIICPYRAQASLVEKLFASSSFDSKNTEIQVGTIHGFQGDECDIVISLFNPPPYISDKPEMFLNKQNILNVSISRAKDYLFILMPDDKTENLINLKKIQRIVQLINEKAKDNSAQFDCFDIEKVMFKNKNFIYENSFSTTHQSVNVYSEAEKLYEFRCEETAIDIQVSSQKV